VQIAKSLYVRLFCKNGTLNKNEDFFGQVRINLGRLRCNLGKNGVRPVKLSLDVFWASLLILGQKFFATLKICLLLHLCYQRYEKRLEQQKGHPDVNVCHAKENLEEEL